MSTDGLNFIANEILFTRSFSYISILQDMPVFSSRSFTFSGCKLRSLNHLWLVSVQCDGDRANCTHISSPAGHSSSIQGERGKQTFCEFQANQDYTVRLCLKNKSCLFIPN